MTRWGKDDKKSEFGPKHFTHLFLPVENGRFSHLVSFCLALHHPKIESAKSNLKDSVALGQTSCFRAMKINSL